MTKLIIVGAGGFGGEVAMIARAMMAAGSAAFDSISFIDDDPSYMRERGREDEISGVIANHQIDPEALYICAVGNPLTKRYLCEKLEREGAKFTRIIHPVSQIDETAQIGLGTVVAFAGGLYPHTNTGRHVHINAYSGLGHDAEIGDFATLSAHVDITGGVKVEEGVFFGTHSCVLPGHTIGQWARIGAGCTISRKVAPEAIIYSEPPKFLSRGKKAVKD